jgi:maleate isomerase
MHRKLLGMLTPSSNTVLEPVTTAMLAEVPEVSAHFGRFAVTEIALSQHALASSRRKRSCGPLACSRTRVAR